MISTVGLQNPVTQTSRAQSEGINSRHAVATVLGQLPVAPWLGELSRPSLATAGLFHQPARCLIG